MIAVPIPVDDAERLEALRALDVLDTPPEERFDRITCVLTLVLRVPMAYISLVDSDRQWFKSSCGLDTAETPRAVSFCGHAILSDEPMVVPDAALDVRFHDNPLVIGEPYIRFYAGHPLNGPGGQKVGTLCIANHRPRTLDESELEALREMAHIVERELGLVEVVHLQRDLISAEQRATEAEHQRAESLGRLVESQRHLLHELTQAAKYEIHRPGGPMMKLSELLATLSSPDGPSDPDELWQFIRREAGKEPLKDDFSLLEIQFG